MSCDPYADALTSRPETEQCRATHPGPYRFACTRAAHDDSDGLHVHASGALVYAQWVSAPALRPDWRLRDQAVDDGGLQ